MKIDPKLHIELQLKTLDATILRLEDVVDKRTRKAEATRDAGDKQVAEHFANALDDRITQAAHLRKELAA